ncbi:MAG TPA: cytochrome b [Casimicrobiaceae bacterium]|nr:cytochrome b [Casimicrobiaceae bacterium]
MNATTRAVAGYDPVAKSLHWLVFALLLAQYIVAFTMPDIGRGTVPGTLIDLHMSFGLTILALVVVRWFWRLRHRVPLATADVPAWEQPIARVTHALLYALLVVNPILGWMNASARDWTITVFGLFQLPHLVAARSPIGRQAGDVHVFLTWALLALVGLHVAAALYHYFGRRDRILQRMLPGAR